jgi:hypothetical protein
MVGSFFYRITVEDYWVEGLEYQDRPVHEC